MKFKYHIAVVNFSESEDRVLESWGNDGWELVSVVAYPAINDPLGFSRKWFYFKKQI
tara:strand:- start:12 stop:182 length:171 start_codon:yes stop_codon:yes gene_type:complete